MDVFEAVRSRRSVKRFKKHKMSSKEIMQLMGHAILSPTSYNIQNWRFVTITEQAVKDKLYTLSYNQRQVAEASLIIILCADLKAWNKSPERYWKNHPQKTRDRISESIRQSYDGNTTLQRDEAFRSCGMAAQTIMLLARAMGYDTCPMEGFQFDKVGRLIGLPQDHIITMMIVVGKKTREAEPRGGQLAISDILFEDHF